MPKNVHLHPARILRMLRDDESAKVALPRTQDSVRRGSIINLPEEALGTKVDDFREPAPIVQRDREEMGTGLLLDWHRVAGDRRKECRAAAVARIGAEDTNAIRCERAEGVQTIDDH